MSKKKKHFKNIKNIIMYKNFNMPNMFMLFLSFVYFFNILLFSTFSPFDCHRFHYVVIAVAVIYNNLGVLLDYRLVDPPIYNPPKEYKDYLRCCFLVLLVYLGLLSSGFYCAFCFHLLFSVCLLFLLLPI